MRRRRQQSVAAAVVLARASSGVRAGKKMPSWLWSAMAVAGLVLAFAAALPTTDSAFSGAAGTPMNTFAAAVLHPPADLVVNSSCTGGPYYQPTYVGASSGLEILSFQDTSFTRPAVQLNDLVVAVFVSGNGVVPGPVGTTPAFTSAASSTLSTSLGVFVQYRWVTDVATEPATYTFRTGSGRATGVVRVYRNVNRTAPFGTAAAWTSAVSGNTVTAPSLTTTVEKTLVLAVQGVKSSVLQPFLSTSGTTLANVSTMYVATGQEASSGTFGQSGDIAMPTTGATGDSHATHTSTSGHRIGLQLPLLPLQKGQITATWTTTPVPSWADGYQLARTTGGTTEQTFTITGRATATYADTTASNGTFTYTLLATASSWRSTTITANVTRTC